MQSKIEEHIVARIKPIITPSYMYAEQDVMPYCVYEVNQIEPIMAKKGVMGWNADISIYLAAESESDSVELKDKVLEALNKRVPGFVINVNAVQPAFAEEQWLQEIDINAKQL